MSEEQRLLLRTSPQWSRPLLALNRGGGFLVGRGNYLEPVVREVAMAMYSEGCMEATYTQEHPVRST